MTHEGIRVEGATAARALFQSLVIVVVKSSFIIAIKVDCACLCLGYSVVKVLGRFRARSSLISWFFLLIDCPLFLARLDVDLEACRAKLPPTDVAHEGFRSERTWWFRD